MRKVITTLLLILGANFPVYAMIDEQASAIQSFTEDARRIISTMP